MSHTRRELLRGTLVGGAAALGLATAAEAAPSDVTTLLRGARRESQVLFRLVAFEQLQAFAYDHVLGSAVLRANAKRTLARFLDQERRHAELLGAALAKHRMAAPSPPSGVAAADRELAALGVSGQLDQAHDEQTAVHLLIAIETVAEELYYAAIETVSGAALLRLSAEVLACEAQHWTGLSSLLHFGDPGLAAPHAFAPLVGQLASP